MRVRWMPQARADLAEIVEHIAKDDPDTAERVYERVLKSVTLLPGQPGLGRPGRVDGTRELVAPRTPFIVPYRVRGGVLEVLAVVRGAREWPDRFE